MEELLQKTKIDNQKLRRLVHRVTANELTNMSEPCYYPEMKKHYFEFLHVCGITDRVVKEFVKRFYKGTPAAKWQLQSDPQSNLYIFIMNYFLINRDQVSFSSTMTMFLIRYYTNLMHRQIPYCNPDVFKYSVENLAKTHLFSREKTIANAVFFLSKEMQRKFMKIIKEAEPMMISKFIQEGRHRLSQSIKSFADTYYKASKSGAALRSPPEIEDDENDYQRQTIERSARAIDTVVKKITIYKVTDRKAMDEAKKLTKVSSSLATMIVNQIVDISYSDNLKIILELFIKSTKEVNLLCGDEYYKHVKTLMGVKRTTARIYFKQQVEVLLRKILEDLKFLDKFVKLTNQTQFLIKSFLAYYLTMVLRNTIC